MGRNSIYRSKKKELIKKSETEYPSQEKQHDTDSIIKIKSEVFSSGDIDYILQTIMDKAIEINTGDLEEAFCDMMAVFWNLRLHGDMIPVRGKSEVSIEVVINIFGRLF